MDETMADILSSFQGEKEEIIPILQKVQTSYSYIPYEAMSAIANVTGVAESAIFGVATFYAQFRFEPLGRNHVQVCRGTSCHVNGAPQVLTNVEERLGIKEGETREDLEYSLETVACIGACSLAPCLMVNDRVEAKIDSKKVKLLFPKEES